MKRLPFRPEFEEAVRSGQKTVTSRTRRYGSVGDVLDTPFGPVRLVSVVRMLLASVVARLWREEDFGNSGEFVDAWVRLHPRRGYIPEQWVWVHEFVLEPQP